MENNIAELTKYYFEIFQNKDLSSLEQLYDDNTILIDWTGQWYGKESVLKANSDLFEIQFDIDVYQIIINNNTSLNMISIRTEDGLTEILDVIEFNEKGKIVKIRAYKG